MIIQRLALALMLGSCFVAHPADWDDSKPTALNCKDACQVYKMQSGDAICTLTGAGIGAEEGGQACVKTEDKCFQNCHAYKTPEMEWTCVSGEGAEAPKK